MRTPERFNLARRSFLFPRPTNTRYDDDMTRWTVAGPLAVNAWLRETFSRNRSKRGLFTSVVSREETLLDHVLEGVEFVGRMDVADRASNGLREAVKWNKAEQNKPSEFGLALSRAFNDPDFSDHNHEHSRRMERWIESFLINIPELRHGQSVSAVVDALLLQPYWHDADQLLSLYRNKTEKLNLPVKKAHGIAGAVMILALHRRYALERKVSVARAWRICGTAGLMMLKHEEPALLTQVLDGQKSALGLTGQELWENYKANQLDILTLTPAQLIELLRLEKQSTDATFGLFPAFAQEYQEELLDLANNHRPVLLDVDADLRQSFRLATEAAVVADMLEMVAPSLESIFRKLNTQYSRSRPFWQDLPLSQYLTLAKGEEGNVSGPDCDVRRVFWEILHLNHLNHGVVANSKFMRKLYRDHALYSAILFRQIGAQIMAGDFDFIKKAYAKREKEILIKAKRKADGGSLDKMAEEKIARLRREAEEIVKIFRQKPDAQDGQPRLYTQSQIEAFLTLADAVISELCGKYGVTPKELNKLTRQVKSGRDPYLPYRTYDSLGGSPRTLVAPIG